MEKLIEMFEKFKIEKSDINEHLQTLFDYGKKCNTIIEFGAGKSTFALGASNPKRFISYDIKGTDRLMKVFMDCIKDTDLNFEYIVKSTLDIEIDKTDLLFIDTKHTYNQIKSELNLHAKNIQKYIIMHDTTVFGKRNEFPEELPNIGLVPAINEFLKDNKDWSIEKRFNNNNGLTIMARS